MRAQGFSRTFFRKWAHFGLGRVPVISDLPEEYSGVL